MTEEKKVPVGVIMVGHLERSNPAVRALEAALIVNREIALSLKKFFKG